VKNERGMTTTETRRVALETGATTTVECWGDAGPAILCVHGLASSRRDFTRLGEALSGTHRVFAYDQRGHGDNAHDDGPLSLTALAADLRAVADCIGTVAVVVGHSLGGAVALIGGPKVARALVLVDPALRVPAGTFARDYVDELGPTLDIPPGDERDAAVRALFVDAHPTDRDGKVHAMRAVSLETLRRIGRDTDDAGGWDLRSRLAALKIPTTILVAGEDSVIAPLDLADRAPVVRVDVIEGHGHTLHRSAFDVFAGAVRAAS
jgi:pimeloyl-ACP methyl ester carboxylesterase